MNRLVTLLLAVTLTLPVFSAPITQEELVRRTQELMDAVALGDRAPFQKYFADDAFFFDEKGRDLTKAQLIADLQPLPKGYANAVIKVVNAKSLVIHDTAVHSYDLDETFTIYGQKLGARFHATDTWMLRNDSWQIVASQVLRYYGDPAVGRVDPKQLADYVGTYELAPGTEIVVSVEGKQLYAQRTGRAREELFAEAADLFFRKGTEGRRLFRRNAAGEVDALIDRRNHEDIVWKRKR
jgi:hypothetical protein